MVAWLRKVLAWAASIFGIELASKGASFIAMKLFLTALFMVGLPFILNSVIYDLLAWAMGYISDASAGSEFDGAMQFSGFLAWLLETFKIPQCIAVLVSALQLRFVLKLIPFSPVR